MMKNKFRQILQSLLLLFSVILLPTNSYTQSTKKTIALVDEYIAAVRADSNLPDINTIIKNKKRYGEVLNLVEYLYNDTLYDVAIESYRITYLLAITSSEKDIRQEAVAQLTKGISHNSKSIGGWCVQHLSVFNREDFNLVAKQNIVSGLESNNVPKLNKLIMLAGYLNISSQISIIENIAINSTNTSDKWAAWLALARMGDEDYINIIVETAKKQKLNDDFVYEIVPDLIYTRQKDAFTVAIDILFNESKNCYSSSPDNDMQIMCGYRVLEYLATVIKDFPYRVKISGDIDTDDYKQALIEVKKWFTNKGSDYVIIDNAF